MCGILGSYERGGISIPRERFELALQRLQRRGPDDVGFWSDDHVRLGHRRLAVVDLSPAGHQPMASSDQRYHIVFNGEIYNHAKLRPRLNPVGGWRGNSDTETLLEAYREWGAGCLDKLNGMFAFAIWDRLERTLFIARDRMGVKPLYYSHSDGRFSFASRPSALTILNGELSSDLNPESLRVFLELGYVPAPLSAHARACKLPPGHYLLLSANRLRLVRYWDFRCIAPDPSMRSRPESELLDELQALIRDAVNLRLLSDVPLGAFLSGGVDSSLVLEGMRAAGVANPKTFTISFTDKQFDEGPAAARISAHLGSDHTQETLRVEDLLDLLPAYVDEYDEPFADSSAFPTLAVSRLARRHVTVALTGDGADELFGGYHYYPMAERLAPIVALRPILRNAARRILSKAPSPRLRLFAGVMQCEDKVGLYNYMRSISKNYPSLITTSLATETNDSESWFAQYAADFAMDLSAAEVGMRLDAGFTLPDMYLQKVDVASMAFSLEARCPMTDYRLVEWCMRLPLEYKLRGGQTKYLLKRALCRSLPAQYVYKPKMGFSVPIARWLRGPLREWSEELLYDESLMSRVPLQKERVRELFNVHQRGEADAHPLLWSVLMLLCFVNKHCGGNQALPAMSVRSVA